MNDEPILAELRKISAWADMQRKVTKWSLIVLAVFIPALIIFGLVMDRRVNTKLESLSSGETPDWYDVDQSVRRGDFDKALETGERLIVKTPLDPEAHRRLAGAYLAAGRIEEAEQHYAEAYRLFPSEEARARLVAIRKRAGATDAQPDAAHKPPPAGAVQESSETINTNQESEAPADSGGRRADSLGE